MTEQVSGDPITCGSVTFNDGATPICSGVALGSPGSDQAQCTTSALTVGSHNITAAYVPGACFFVGSTSSIVAQSVMAQLLLTPYNIGFVPSLVGNPGTGTTTAPPRTITVKNQSTGPVTMGTVSISPSQFAIASNTCNGVTLAAGDSCTVGVDFTATTVTTYTGQVQFPSTAPNSSQSVGLSGTGQAALMNAVAPVQFPNTVVGVTSATKSVKLVNGNPMPVEFDMTGAAFVGDSCGMAIASDGCTGNTLGYSGSVTPPNSCIIGVSFTPVAPGPCTATLSVSSAAGNSPQLVTLTGTGTLSILTFTPKSLTFASQTSGTTSAEKTVTVTNPNVATAGGTINIGSIGITGDFILSTDGCSNTSVAGGSTCTLGVEFSPTTTGTLTGMVSIPDNAGTGTQTFNLTGTGK